MEPTPFRIAESKQSFIPAKTPPNWRTMTPEDSRGYVWLFEPPMPNATYVIGVDPTQGITGWDRSMMTDSEKTDNAAIEVFRIGKREVTIKDEATGKESTTTIPTDYQVAEYAGPIDFEASAAIVNALGRLYRGKGSMGCAHTIIEVFPGPGWMVEKTLISKYGYLNFYQPKYINTLLPTVAGKGIGWSANHKSVRDLWVLGTRRFNNRSVVVRSPWLLKEMETTDPIKFYEYTSEATSGFHDDRLRATMLVLWAAHDFSSTVRVFTETTIMKGEKPVNWQQSDLSIESLEEEWNRRFHEIGDMN